MDRSDQHSQAAGELTRAFLAAPWTAERLAEEGAACFEHWPVWMLALAQRVVSVFRVAPADRRDLMALIAEFLAQHADPAELTALGPLPADDSAPMPWVNRPLAQYPAPPVRRAPVPKWPVAKIASTAELAERLELSLGQLEWLADVRGLERTVAREQLRNYRYRTVGRSGAMPRLIEAPKLRLKEVQRWIAREILSVVPAHPAAHGFVAGRSAVTHAELHTGRAAVLRLDLKDFFASVPAARIYGLWRALGYGPAVAHALTGLSTNVVPLTVWERIAAATDADQVQPRFHLGRRLATPHLPQGAPTSPALANLVVFRLDRRLAGLAQASGLSYSRYADDLTFSGTARLIRRRGQFEQFVGVIVREEGFRLNPAKAAAQSAGGRQSVCGVVVNTRTNVRRDDYDELRAILHNAARFGPASQNHAQLDDFRAHLLGRVSWVRALNPGRGRRLAKLLDAIDWSA